MARLRLAPAHCRWLPLAPALALALGAVVGCGRLARDFEDICHAEERAGVGAVSDPAEKAHRIATWIAGRLRTKDAKRSMGALAAVPCEAKAGILREMAREAGYHGPCPMADYSDRQCARTGPPRAAARDAAPAR